VTRGLLVCALLTGLVAAACGGSEGRVVRVSAAASLTEAFTELGKAFEAEQPDTTVRFNFGASSALAQQVNRGAPADVFASADESSMKMVSDAGNASGPAVFARNRPALLVTKGNPKAIKGLADLARPGVTFLSCDPDVPCGRVGLGALRKAGVDARPTSLEENVKGVVSKVVLGEADAGIVYATDVQAVDGRAEGVAIDVARDPSLVSAYLIAVTSEVGDVEGARAWIDFVCSDRGRQTLSRFGFLPP
jgi:molybdate transport system substrate-binding protein